MTILKPMLATDYVEGELRFGVHGYLASPKLDGYRAFNQAGDLYTRSGKPIANKATQAVFSHSAFNGFDGELIVGDPGAKNAFDNTSGPLRRFEGDPGACWYVFDDRSHDGPFIERLDHLQRRVSALCQELPKSLMGRIKVVPQELITNLFQLDEFETRALEDGYEGAMLRRPDSPYKHGRSTVKEGYLLKVKRRATEEARIVRMEQLMHNGNEAFKDELGRTKRSDNAEGLIPSGMVGSIWVIDLEKWPREFKISAGSMTHAQRKAAWEARECYTGQLARFTFLPHGERDVPREGVFDGIRAEEDTGE